MQRRKALQRSSLVRALLIGACALGPTHCVVADHPRTVPIQGTLPSAIALPDDIEQLLWWLPEETEAVLVSRGNVPLRLFECSVSDPELATTTRSLPSAHRWEKMMEQYQDLVAAECVEPLVCFTAPYPDEVREKLIKSFYSQRTARLFAKAAWWDAGATRQTADVVVFRDKTAARMIDAFAAYHNVRRNVDGLRVLEVDLNHGRPGDWTGQPIPEDLNDLKSSPNRPNPMYLAAPQANVYVATTSMPLMKAIIGRMVQRGLRRSLPPELPEWRYLDVTAPAWGLRHYRAATAAKDRLSMLRRDSRAQGLVFFGGNKPSQSLTLRYVSKSGDAGASFLRMQADWFGIRDTSVVAPMGRVDLGCVERRTQINVLPTESEGMPWKALSVEVTLDCIHRMYCPWLGFCCPTLATQSDGK